MSEFDLDDLFKAPEHGKRASCSVVLCPYCGKPAELHTGEAVYPHRKDLYSLKFWVCSPCDAYVGCHKPGATYAPGKVSDGTVPLGRLANQKLRLFKGMAHDAIDPLWKGGLFYSRNALYSALALQLNIPKANCHIGEFDEDQCRKVVKAVALIRDNLTVHKDKSPFYPYLSQKAQKELKKGKRNVG